MFHVEHFERCDNLKHDYSPMLNPVNKGFDTTAALNNATYLDYYKRLRLLALSMFEWENLPDSMNERFLEKTLYMYGLACFCYDNDFGWLSLRCIPSAELNVYEESLKYTAYSINYSKTFNRNEIVLVRNNLDQLPTDMTIHLFARRLYECERTIDINIKAQKTPVLVKCGEKQRLTLKNVYMNYDGNAPVIFGDKDLDTTGFEVLQTNAPFVADKLAEYKRNVWSEMLSFLGVNNVATEKAERLVTDEVNANNQMVQLAAETMLLTRQQAAKELNELYGFNVKVKLRTYDEMKELLKLESETEEEETGAADSE
nr:MAG: Connector [Bacteriophage sp.]